MDSNETEGSIPEGDTLNTEAMMFDYPRLKRYLVCFPLTATSWGVRGGMGEAWRFNFDSEEVSRAFWLLLSRLDGMSSREEILEGLSANDVDLKTGPRLLERLEEAGFLEDGRSGVFPRNGTDEPRDQLVFFSRFSTDGGYELQSRLRELRVCVIGQGAFAESVVAQLKKTGFCNTSLRPTTHLPKAARGPIVQAESMPVPDAAEELIWPQEESGTRPGFFILPQSSHEPTLLEAMDAYSKRHRVPWMLLRVVSVHEGWAGPMFIPGETASYLSFEARLRSNFEHLEDYEAFDDYVRVSENRPPFLGAFAVLFDLLASIASIEIAKYASNIAIPKLAGHFLSVNSFEWETELHEVLKVPRLDMDAPRQQLFPWKEVAFAAKNRRA